LPESFDTGGIVGVVVIKVCMKRHCSKWFHGPFGWVLADARRLPFKRCKGRLKFFHARIRTTKAG
jgi:C4-dicarboxylate-specific signal transduction histidine kinase